MRSLLWLAFAAACAWLVAALVVRSRRSAIPADWTEPDADGEALPPDPRTWEIIAMGMPSRTVTANPWKPTFETSTPWYVAACGYAHPWGVCNGGHDLAWQR